MERVQLSSRVQVPSAQADGPIGFYLCRAYAARMGRRLRSIGVAGLALGGLAMVGGTVVGGDLRPLAMGYGVLVALPAACLLLGMLVRERPWRRPPRPLHQTTKVESLAGRRVF